MNQPKAKIANRKTGRRQKNLPTSVVLEWAMSVEGGPHYGSGDQMDGLRRNPVGPGVNVASSAMHRRGSSNPIVPSRAVDIHAPSSHRHLVSVSNRDTTTLPKLSKFSEATLKPDGRPRALNQLPFTFRLCHLFQNCDLTREGK